MSGGNEIAGLGLSIRYTDVEKANKELGELSAKGKQAETAASRMERSWLKANKSLLALGVGVGVFGALTMAVKGAITTNMEYERSMSNVASVAGATKEQLGQLSAAAREMARTSVYSARETAEGMYFLASAGMKVNEIISAQRGVLALAAATQADLAFTSEAVASALSQFNLEATDATRVANVYAAAISQSQATMGKLADSMRYAGPIAGQLGQSIEQTSAQLMAMYNAGLRGEQAGTSLRTAMLRLQDPTAEVAQTFASMGVALTDAQGKTRPFMAVLKDLAGANMDAAQASKIFGQEAASGMLAVVKNISQVERYTSAITGTQKASEMALVQLDNLWGDLKKLASATEEAAISLGGTLAPVLREIVQLMTFAVEHGTATIATLTGIGVAAAAIHAGGIGALATNLASLGVKAVGPLKSLVTWAGKASIALGDLGLMGVTHGLARSIDNAGTAVHIFGEKRLFNLHNRLNAVRGPLEGAGTNLLNLSKKAFAAGGSLAFLTNPITLTIAGIAALAAGLYYLSQNTETAFEKMDRLAESATKAAREYEKINSQVLAAEKATEKYEKELEKAGDNYDEIQKAVQGLSNTYPQLVSAYNDGRIGLIELNEELAINNRLQEENRRLAQEAKDAAGAAYIKGVPESVKEGLTEMQSSLFYFSSEAAVEHAKSRINEFAENAYKQFNRLREFAHLPGYEEDLAEILQGLREAQRVATHFEETVGKAVTSAPAAMIEKINRILGESKNEWVAINSEIDKATTKIQTLSNIHPFPNLERATAMLREQLNSTGSADSQQRLARTQALHNYLSQLENVPKEAKGTDKEYEYRIQQYEKYQLELQVIDKRFAEERKQNQFDAAQQNQAVLAQMKADELTYQGDKIGAINATYEHQIAALQSELEFKRSTNALTAEEEKTLNNKILKANKDRDREIKKTAKEQQKAVLEIQRKGQDDLLSLAQQTEDAQTAAAKAGITDRQQLAALDYQERLRQLDRWLADEQRKIERQLADLDKDYTKSAKEREAIAEYLQGRLGAIEKLGAAKRLQIEAEYNEKRKSGWQKLLDDWGDFEKRREDLTLEALKNIQNEFANTFRGILTGEIDSFEDAFKAFADNVLNIFANLMAQLVSEWMVSGLIKYIFGEDGQKIEVYHYHISSDSGNGIMDQSSGNNPLNMFKEFFGGSGSQAADTNYGAVQGDWAGINSDIGGSSMGWGSYGSAASYGSDWAGITSEIGAGSSSGWGSMASSMGSYMGYAYVISEFMKDMNALFSGNDSTEQVGTMGLSALFGVIGGYLGGGAGSAAGVMLAKLIGPSLFDQGDDTADRERDASDFYRIYDELRRASNMDEDIDPADYLNAVNLGLRSDNRVPFKDMDELYERLREKDKLPWWAGTPSQVSTARHFTGGESAYWGQPDWMRFRLFGNNLPGQTGDSGMAQWFGGEGEGAWGGGSWNKVKGALDEMDAETLDKLGEALFNVKDGAAAFGVDLTDIMDKFTMAQLESGEWATILKDELSPASLMAAMGDKMRAEGMNNLEIAAQKQAAAIDSLLGTFDMGEEDTDAWMEQLFKANAEQEDLSKKMAEYQDIVEQLKHVKAGEEEKTKDLITRGRELREELGLGESAFSKIEKGFEDFVKAMEDIAKRLLDAAGGDGESSHHGGLIYHSGGLVGAMLQTGMITAHGGSPRMHDGGLRYDERLTILQAGEYVVQRSSVNPETLAALRSINATGRLPMEMMSRAMERLQDQPSFHTGGPVTVAPAMSSAPQPQGGDNGKPQVVINFNPQITVSAENGADAAKIEAAVTKALEKSRVALKRQLEQTGYQVVDAQ